MEIQVDPLRALVIAFFTLLVMLFAGYLDGCVDASKYSRYSGMRHPVTVLSKAKTGILLLDSAGTYYFIEDMDSIYTLVKDRYVIGDTVSPGYFIIMEPKESY